MTESKIDLAMALFARQIRVEIVQAINRWRAGTRRERIAGTLLIAAIPLALLVYCYTSGELFAAFRLYLTGHTTTATIESCVPTVLSIKDGQTGLAMRVKTTAQADPLPTVWCGQRDVGQQVTVLYSRASQHGVAIKGTVTLPKVILNEFGWVNVFGFVAYTSVFAFMALLQLLLLGAFVVSTIVITTTRALKQTPRESARTIHVTELLTDALFLVLLFTALGVILYGIFKGLLYSQVTDKLSYGALSTAVIAFVISPAPYALVSFAWKAYKSATIAIVRNLIVSGLLLASIYRVLSFINTADFASYSGAKQIILEVLKAAVGLN